jgi:hypothetical protein
MGCLSEIMGKGSAQTSRFDGKSCFIDSSISAFLSELRDDCKSMQTSFEKKFGVINVIHNCAISSAMRRCVDPTVQRNVATSPCSIRLFDSEQRLQVLALHPIGFFTVHKHL